MKFDMPNLQGEITELELENALIAQLRKQFRSTDQEDAFVRIHDDVSLVKNLRKQLELFNGMEFSDAEFRRLMNSLVDLLLINFN